MPLLRGYSLLGPWTECSNGKYTFARKDEKEYFIKSFPYPKYPVEGMYSPRVADRMKADCREWEKSQNQLIGELKKIAGIGGNLVVPLELFRDGNSYYKITLKISTDSMPVDMIAKLPSANKRLLLKTMSQSLRTLHKARVVHGDLKPDNILIAKSEAGNLTTKITDFDDSYFEGDPPRPEYTVGTVNYYSPELAQYIIGEDESIKKYVQCRSDVFAMGLIFHQYICGRMPEYDGYDYAYEAVLDGRSLLTDPSIAEGTRNLIDSMLLANFDKRPSIAEVFERLKELEAIEDEIYHRVAAKPRTFTIPKRAGSLATPAKTAEPVKKTEDAISTVERLPNNQYKITYSSGKQRIVPEIFIKAQNLEELLVK
ncbi:MAG: protein kinase [Eubacteriaceae bacterium]|nr:protein kinase [Eubacteriaceae bacterium]